MFADPDAQPFPNTDTHRPSAAEPAPPHAVAGEPCAVAGDAALTESAHRILEHVFGYPAFRGEQQQIVEHVARGGDALVLMPTGGGKSLCYQIPALLREGTAIVVSPLIALMQDQVSALVEAGVNAAFLNSSLDMDAARSVERALWEGTLDLLYVAPERLMTPRFLDQLDHLRDTGRLALFAIDEAHCVSQWGHDFRPEYLQLSILPERYPAIPRIALTATADRQTREEIAERLNLTRARRFVSSFDSPTSATPSLTRTTRAASCCTSSARNAPARRASCIACRGARWKRPLPGCRSRASTPCPTTQVWHRRCAPSTRRAFCAKTA